MNDNAGLPLGWQDTLLEQLTQTFLLPELELRRQRGLSVPTLEALRGFQILFYPDGRRPTVRIDAEVRAIAEVKPSPDVTIHEGEVVTTGDIESISRISLKDHEADYGHATFLRTQRGWEGYFDFVYHKGLARMHAAQAEQFLAAAQDALTRGHMVVFADTLFTAAELAAKASLLCLVGDEVVTAKKHATVRTTFNRQRNVGNVDKSHSETFNKLWDLRDAKYLEREVSLTNGEAQRHLSNVEGMIKAASSWTD